MAGPPVTGEPAFRPFDKLRVVPSAVERQLLRCVATRRSRAARASGRHEAILRRPVLMESRVRAQAIARRELESGVAPVLAGLVGRVAHLRQQILIPIVGLREAAEAREIAVAQNDDVDAGRGRDLVRVVDALERFDHHDAQHVVVD